MKFFETTACAHLWIYLYTIAFFLFSFNITANWILKLNNNFHIVSKTSIRNSTVQPKETIVFKVRTYNLFSIHSLFPNFIHVASQRFDVNQQKWSIVLETNRNIKFILFPPIHLLLRETLLHTSYEYSILLLANENASYEHDPSISFIHKNESSIITSSQFFSWLVKRVSTGKTGWKLLATGSEGSLQRERRTGINRRFATKPIVEWNLSGSRMNEIVQRSPLHSLRLRLIFLCFILYRSLSVSCQLPCLRYEWATGWSLNDRSDFLCDVTDFSFHVFDFHSFKINNMDDFFGIYSSECLYFLWFYIFYRLCSILAFLYAR